MWREFLSWFGLATAKELREVAEARTRERDDLNEALVAARDAAEFWRSWAAGTVEMKNEYLHELAKREVV